MNSDKDAKSQQGGRMTQQQDEPPSLRITAPHTNSFKLESQNDQLIVDFQTQTNIFKKLQHASKLLTIEPDVGAKALISEILSDRKQAVLDNEQYTYMMALIQCLGVLSGRSDVAEAFLISGMEQGVWEQRRTWRLAEEDRETNQNPSLRRRCLLALALDGRYPIANEVDRIRNLPQEEAAEWCGAATWAMFTHDMVKRFGLEEWLRINGEDDHKSSLYREWGTGQGKDLYQWYLKLRDVEQ